MNTDTTLHMRTEPEYMQAEPDFSVFLADIWRAKIYIMIGVVLGVLAAVVFMGAARPHYMAHMIIGPATYDTASDMRGFLLSDGVAAAQYQGQYPGQDQRGRDIAIENFIRFETMLRGTRVAAHIMQDARVMQILHDAKRFSGSSPAIEPHSMAADISRFLHRRIRIEAVGSTALRRVVFLHPRKEDALYLLQRLVAVTDTIMRDENISRMTGREEALRERLAQTRSHEHRRALTALLLEQEHRRIVADIDGAYAVMVVEPAHAPDIPSWPRRAIIWPVAVILGGFSGFLIFQITGGIRGRKS